MPDELAIEQLRRHEDAKGKMASTFMADWQTISQYFLPQDSNIQVDKMEGISGWTDRIFDTTAIMAAQTLEAGQMNWLTPSNEPWALYEPPEGVDSDTDDAALWLGKGSTAVAKEFARSNFYSIVDLHYLGVCVFGTDFILMEEGKNGGYNFRHAKIGTYTLEENSEGIVDTTRREFEMTYRQAKQEYGEDALPAKMAEQARGQTGLAKKFKFLHCIFPREDSKRVSRRMDGPNKPFASVTIAVDFKECVKVSGYDEQPALVSRWKKWGTDSPFGYGPAYIALADARQLNYIQQYLDALAELHAYPRVLQPDDLEGDVDLRAGGITTYTDPNKKPEEWITSGDYKLGMDLQEQKRKALRDAFFVDMLKMLNTDPLLTKEMTAYEIAQRKAEGLNQFTPVFLRRVSEFMNPLLRRAFAISYRQGKLGKAPASMFRKVKEGVVALQMPEITITSRISLEIKALQNRGTVETFQFIQPFIEVAPDMLDNFDLDKVIRDYSRNSAMAPDLMRKMTGANSVMAIRQQRAQIQQQQRALEAAKSLGSAGKGLGGSPKWAQDAAQQAVTGDSG